MDVYRRIAHHAIGECVARIVFQHHGGRRRARVADPRGGAGDLEERLLGGDGVSRAQHLHRLQQRVGRLQRGAVDVVLHGQLVSEARREMIAQRVSEKPPVVPFRAVGDPRHRVRVLLERLPVPFGEDPRRLGRQLRDDRRRVEVRTRHARHERARGEPQVGDCQCDYHYRHRSSPDQR